MAAKEENANESFFSRFEFLSYSRFFLLHCAKEREWKGETKENRADTQKRCKLSRQKYLTFDQRWSRDQLYEKPKTASPYFERKRQLNCNIMFSACTTGRHLLLDLPELPAFRARDERLRVPGLRGREVAERKQDGVLRPPAQGEAQFHFPTKPSGL